MKLKYYLRGLGIGIIVTTLILMISFSMHKTEISDEEIIERAEQLGMIMPEDEMETPASSENEETAVTDDKMQEEEQTDIQPENSEGTETDTVTDTETITDTEADPVENTSESYTLVVQRGEVCRTICEELQANGLVDDAEAFRKYLGSVGFASSIGSGTYEVPYGLSYEEIYNILKAGPAEAH